MDTTEFSSSGRDEGSGYDRNVDAGNLSSSPSYSPATALETHNSYALSSSNYTHTPVTTSSTDYNRGFTGTDSHHTTIPISSGAGAGEVHEEQYPSPKTSTGFATESHGTQDHAPALSSSSSSSSSSSVSQEKNKFDTKNNQDISESAVPPTGDGNLPISDGQTSATSGKETAAPSTKATTKTDATAGTNSNEGSSNKNRISGMFKTLKRKFSKRKSSTSAENSTVDKAQATGITTAPEPTTEHSQNKETREVAPPLAQDIAH